MDDIVRSEVERITKLKSLPPKNLKLAEEDFNHGFRLIYSRMPKRQSDEILFQQTKKQKQTPALKDITNRPTFTATPRKLFGLVKRGRKNGKKGAEHTVKMIQSA